MSCFEGQKKNNLSSNNIDPTRLMLQYTDSTLHTMNGSSSSASSDDENYYSATEFASPEKKSNAASVEALATSLKALNEASHQAMDYVNRCASIEPPTEKDDSRHISTTNPWKNTQAIAERLEISRSKIDQAWKQAQQAHDSLYDNASDEKYKNKSENSDETETNEYNNIDFTVPIHLDMEAAVDGSTDSTTTHKQPVQAKPPSENFRSLYMDMMTETLAEDLEDMHQQGDVDVDILVQCLSSGMQFLTETHDAAFFDSLGYDGTKDEAMKTEVQHQSSDGLVLSIHQIKQQRLGYLVNE